MDEERPLRCWTERKKIESAKLRAALAIPAGAQPVASLDFANREPRRCPRCTRMWDLLFYVLIIAVLAVLVVVAGVVVRGYLTGTSPTAAFFGPKPDPRLYVSEQASLDGRRRLLLVRRDDVEHLIMTGGPVDVVIETGISVRHAPYSSAAQAQPAASFDRAARAFGQKASDG